jgi:hypothetical protein
VTLSADNRYRRREADCGSVSLLAGAGTGVWILQSGAKSKAMLKLSPALRYV